jgi:isoamylase
VWFRPDGHPMSDENWFDDGARSLGMWIDGSESLSRTRDGELVSDDSWLLLLHAGNEAAEFTLPPERYGDDYEPVLDSSSPDGKPREPEPLDPGEKIMMPARSLLLLRARR